MKEDIGDRTSFLCQECHQSTCVECQTLVHPGRTCVENQAIGHITDDLGTAAPCPKCKAPGMKEDEADCDRLICTQCRPPTPYCAICSAPYDGDFGIRKTDNSAHEPTCKNYRDPETGKPPAHTLRRAAEEKAKSKGKSTSPPPPTKAVVWTVIYPDDIK